MRDRLNINESYRVSILKDLAEKNILGLRLAKNVDIFFLAVALGLDSPKDIQGKKEGYFLIYNNVGTMEKSLLGSILLGQKENSKDIDKFANADINYDESERCAESGFLKLKEKIDAANWDEEFLEKRLIQEIQLLYEKNVKSNI